MQKKVYRIGNLDCANCAAKIEAKFNAHPAVQEAVITFATGQLRLTAEDPDALLPELTAIARTVEGNVVISPRDSHSPERHHHSHDTCSCSHDHDHDHDSCSCGHHHDHDHDSCSCGHHHDHDHDACSCGHHHDHDHDSCSCGHHHDHDHDSCSCSHDHDSCSCGHHHDHDHTHSPNPEEHPSGHSHDHGDESPLPLILGASLFVLGLLLENTSLSFLTLPLGLVAWILLGKDIAMKAWRNLRKGHILDENFLMTIASIGAFFIGNAPEGVGVMLFYRVGEYFEHKAVERSRSQIMAAVDLRPEVVHRVENGKVRQIPASEARVGDLLLVRPGDRIPLDGTVVKGESRIDTAPITGEPVPVRAAPGSAVTSGCVNTTGQLLIRADKPLEQSMVTRILNSVENAAASKPKIDRFITRFATVYTPIVVAAAAAIALIPSVLTGDWSYWVYTALTFLVMSCPCALVLSVPLAFFAGIGAGSKAGILFKGGQSMEAMEKIKTVILDKTGTITKGDFRLQRVVGPQSLLALCASCEQRSTHPIAESIVAAARERNLALHTPEEVEELPGKGLRCRLEGREILCGNESLLRDTGISFPRITDYGTLVLVAADGVYQGCLLICDTIKPGAETTVRLLRESGIETVMLTGDTEEAARQVAGKAGIRQVFGGLLPHQKLERLQDIRREKGAVMFVGDGINDAPVLAGADVGAAMGSGADAAIEAADVVFMTSDLEAIHKSLSIAKKTGAIARQNVAFALAVKLIVMVLGLLGYANMWLAVFADSGVALLCVLNSIRLLYKK